MKFKKFTLKNFAVGMSALATAVFGCFLVLVSLWFMLPNSGQAALSGGGTNTDLGAVFNLSGASGSSFSPDMLNQSAHEARVVVTLTAITGTITVTIYGKDGASGQYFSLLASTAIGSTGQTVLEVGPGLTAVSNSVVNDYLPPIWRIGYSVSSGGSATGSIGGSTVE